MNLEALEHLDWVALGTGALALVTFILVLETRAARRDATDKANVVARMTMSRAGDVIDAVNLDNLGPAIARDVALSMTYLTANGVEAAPTATRTIPAMAPGDHYPFVPALILLGPGDHRGLDKADEEAAEQGWSLRLSWSWTDNRRRIGRRGHQVHSEETVVNLASYRSAVTKGPLFIEESLLGEVRKLREELHRRDFRDEARLGFAKSTGRPDVDAIVEEMRFRAHLKVWRARLDRLLGRGLNQRWDKTRRVKRRRRLDSPGSREGRNDRRG